MDNLKKLTLDDIGRIMYQDQQSPPSIIKFYSSRCDMCHKLAPFYEDLADEFYEQLDFFVFDVDLIGDALEVVFPQVNGVPTLCTVDSPGRLKILPDPPTPSEDTWYHEDDIRNFIKEILK